MFHNSSVLKFSALKTNFPRLILSRQCWNRIFQPLQSRSENHIWNIRGCTREHPRAPESIWESLWFHQAPRSHSVS